MAYHNFPDPLRKLLPFFEPLFLVFYDVFNNVPADSDVSDKSVDVDGVLDERLNEKILKILLFLKSSSRSFWFYSKTISGNE